MTTKSAVLLLLLGFALLLGSCGPFGYVIYREVFSQPVARFPISPDTNTPSGPVHVAPGALARIAIEGRIETQSVQEDASGVETKYQPRFRFPLEYTVEEPSGRVLATDSEVLAWDGAATTRTDEEVDSHGGTLSARKNFDKFMAPASGAIAVRLSVEADGTYGASLSNPELLVYDGLIDNTSYVLSGIGMLVAGLVAAMVGLAFTIASAAAAPAPAARQAMQRPAPPGSTDVAIVDSPRRAAMIHFSGLLGYLFPFGNVIAPVVLWMYWRDGDALVESAGREAVNFQLSVIIYYFLSVVLAILIVGFILLIATAIFHLAFMIIAGVRAEQGESFRYPFIIQFIQP